MSYLQAILLGILEGLTEFLPISSTGHLLLAEKFLSVPSTEFTKTFTVVIQLAAILAVIWAFREKIFSSFNLWKQTIIAFVPTGIIAILFYDLIKEVLFEDPLVIVYSLFVGGVLLLFVDRLPKISQGKRDLNSLTIPQLFIIGIFQSFSIIPGISRSAASIVGGMSTGLSRFSAVEFSFFLAVPTMVAASGYDLVKSGFAFTPSEFLILAVGCFFSFLSALLAVTTFIKVVKKHDFTIFALYRIAFAFIVWLVLKS